MIGPLADPAADAAPARRGIFRIVLAVALALAAASALWLLRDRAAEWIVVAIAYLHSVRRTWWALPLFAALYTLSAVLVVPVTLLSIAAVLLWGWKAGGAIELVTCTVAALGPFFIARSMMPRWIAARLASRPLLHAGQREDAFVILLLMRLVPVVPYPLLNYLAGAARFRLRDYVVATFAGSIPAVFVFAYLVDALVAGIIDLRTAYFRLLIAGGGTAALLLAARVAAGRLRRAGIALDRSGAGAEARNGPGQ